MTTNSKGYPIVPAPEGIERERQRRTRLLRSDRLYAADEAAREAAQLEIRTGVYVSVNEAVVPPTPEWLAKHDTAPVTVQADGEGHHARSVKTVRRVLVGHAMRAHQQGKINDRQLKACAWYRDQYEESGLEGRVASANFDQRIVGGMHGAVFSDRQVEAQDILRRARDTIKPRWRKFFDLVILHDQPTKRASRMSQCRRNPFDTIRQCSDAVADWLGLA